MPGYNLASHRLLGSRKNNIVFEIQINHTPRAAAENARDVRERHKKEEQQLRQWRQSNKMKLVTLLGLLCVLLGTQGDASNPFEQLATGALSMGSQLLDRLQDGQMVQPQMNFDTPLLAVHSKSQLGFGNAMRRKGNDDDDDSSSSEERRKRRSVMHNHAHRRGKRAPCFKMMSSATTTEASDDVEARKKRAQKRAAANNAARSRIVKKTKKKKKLHTRRRRRRRQAQEQAERLGPTVGDRIKGLWLAFVDNVVDMAQQMREKIRATAAQAPSGGN